MSPAEALLVLVALSAFPTVMFLGLCRGLRKLQDTSTMGTLSREYGVELREVTLQDAVESVLGRERDDDGSPPEFRF